MGIPFDENAATKILVSATTTATRSDIGLKATRLLQKTQQCHLVLRESRYKNLERKSTYVSGQFRLVYGLCGPHFELRGLKVGMECSSHT